MKLMTAESLIKLLDANGIQLKNMVMILVCMVGLVGIFLTYPLMKLFKLHLDILCKHFGLIK